MNLASPVGVTAFTMCVMCSKIFIVHSVMQASFLSWCSLTGYNNKFGFSLVCDHSCANFSLVRLIKETRSSQMNLCGRFCNFSMPYMAHVTVVHYCSTRHCPVCGVDHM